MAFDLTLHDALRELVNGNGEPLAELVERGYTHNLHETLEHYPEAREKIAKAIRTGRPLKRREHPFDREYREKRDWYLFGRVAYWIGRGFDDKWQDQKEDTVWHMAVQEWPEVPTEGWYNLPRPEASSLQKRWQKETKEPNAFRDTNMTHQFCDGVAHEVTDHDDPARFLAAQFSKADRLGLLPLLYTPAFLSLFAAHPESK